MAGLTNAQFFTGNLQLISAYFEELAIVSVQKESLPVVIEQLKTMRLIINELITGGHEADPRRIADIVMEGQKKLEATSK